MFSADNEEGKKITIIVQNGQVTKHVLDDISKQQRNETSTQYKDDTIKTETHNERNDNDEHKGVIETVTTTLVSILGVIARKQIIQVIVGRILPRFLEHQKSDTGSSSNMLGIPVREESPDVEDTPWRLIQSESYITNPTDFTAKTPFFSYEKSETVNGEQNKTNPSSSTNAIDYAKLHQIPRKLEQRYFEDNDDDDGDVVLP